MTLSLGVAEMLAMKTFVLLYHGYAPPLPGRQAGWSVWLQRRAASFDDVGAAFGPGRIVTNERTFELSLTSNPASGYSIVEAEHLDAAEQLLEGCPIADSVSLYEVWPIDGRTTPNH
ncbi:MAG: hypothetical protein OES57_07870 [Acidimicrobiia bacterium]|nr:hypothetical protein [Acidimicrobiia bacterium]